MLTAIHKYRLEATVLLLFLVYALVLNLQLLGGSNLHTYIAAHDEYLTVRQVYNILEPASWKHFVMAVISGEKLYYGRLMFYTDAAIAFIPYKIWGLSGMVLAIRMTHAVLIVFALFVLGRNFLSKPWQRGTFYLVGILGIYTTYFMMLPKPEPFQLFFLALFFSQWKRQNWVFGRHFIWLGIAYGIKFNIVVLIPVFLVFAWFSGQRPGQTFRTIGMQFLMAFVWLLLGFVVANPCMALVPLNPMFLNTYLSHTYFNTRLADDVASTSWTEWLFQSYGFSYWGHNALVIVFLLLLVGAAVYYLWRLVKTRTVSNGLLIGVSALGLFLPIVFFTKRLWPHYLWESHVLFVLLFLILAQEILEYRHKLGVGIIAILLACFTFQGIKFASSQASVFFNLNKTFADEMAHWTEVKNYLVAKKPDARILQDMGLWYPFAEFVKINRYHPFAGNLPDNLNEPRISWELPEDPGKPDSATDFLVLKKMIPESALVSGSPDLQKQEGIWKQQMRGSIPRVWIKDTTMHGIEIYARK